MPATRLRNSDGSPTRSNPGFVDALPGPSYTTGVPNFVIRKFRVPMFLLPIYQAAGIQYGMRWEVLAAINEIETDYGRNLNVSSAGALGWMQFMPSTWRMLRHRRQQGRQEGPLQPRRRDLRRRALPQGRRTTRRTSARAIFAYNHADWYVDSVMLRARLIAGVPADLVGSLTGLTEGRFPVAARARYADDLQEKASSSSASRPARTPPTSSRPTTAAARSRSSPSKGAPVVATNDGVDQEDRAEREARPLHRSSRTSTATATPTPASAGPRATTPSPRRRDHPDATGRA